MSEIQYEECSLEEATHIELGGKVHKLGSGIVHKRICFGSYHGITVCYDEWREQNSIYTGVFPILGIKPLREIKPEPIVFEAAFAHYDGKWHPLYSLDDGLSYQNCKKATFKCVEILKEDEK